MYNFTQLINKKIKSSLSKHLLFTFAIFLVFNSILNASNYYVDKNAQGSNNGTNWTNAWESFSAINWKIVKPGDIVYISGGSDSTVYNETLNIGASGNSNNLVIVTKGKDTGHNGTVVINGGLARNGIEISGKQYLKISNITLRNCSEGIDLGSSNVIYIDSIRSYNFYNQGGLIKISGYPSNANVDSVFIRYCYANSSYSTKNQTDVIYAQYAKNVFILNDSLIVNSTWTDGKPSDGSHTDGIQVAWQMYNLTVANCYVSNLTSSLTNTHSNGFMTADCMGTWRIYNNIVYCPNFSNSGNNVLYYSNNGQTDADGHIEICNNDLIGGGTSNLLANNGDSGMLIKNNIFYQTRRPIAGSVVFYNSLTNWSQLNNNLYSPNCQSTAGGNNTIIYYGGSKTMAQMQKLGAETNGVNLEDPLFLSPYTDLKLKNGSPAIDNGIALGSPYNVDRAGNLRPQGSAWDIGAYQYNSNITIEKGAMVNIKVILSGDYDNGTMSTVLDDRGFIPLSQPYGVAPWNYNGSEKVTSIPSGIVDWILIELRSNTSAASIISTRAAFLRNDGQVVDLDGISPVLFSNVTPGAYYIVVKHRNHLAIMSANKINLSMNSSLYNFTDSESKAYGTNAMEDLGDGHFGLYSGDANGDGSVSLSDINSVWLNQFLNSKDGYQSADFNLDGSVTASDNNIFWLNNNGKNTQVPN